MTLETIHDTGPSDNRIDIVVLTEGYTSADHAAGTADAHVQALMDYLFNGLAVTQPFGRYENFFNVHVVPLVSNESGADHPTTGDPDTALEAEYYGDGVTERLLVVDYQSAVAALDEALAGTGIDAEMRVVTVNSDIYGGSGGYFAVFAGGNSYATDVALHELGHSFAGLGDQYGGGQTYVGDPATIAGKPDLATDATGSKWAQWLGYVDPDNPAAGPIGAYEGGFYVDTGIWRPSYDSKMRSLEQPFDAIGREQFILGFYDLVNPLDGHSANGGTLRNVDDFLADVVDPAVILVDWTVNASSFVASGENFSLEDHGLSGGDFTITARAYDPTLWVRLDRSSLEQTVTWTVVNDGIRNGTAGGDSLFVGSGNDTLNGLGGNDTLTGGAGDDRLDGGIGDDSLVGGLGFDIVNYGTANGAITASLAGGHGGGADHGNDALSGIEGLVGSAFDDMLTGSTQANRLEGGAGNDSINGGAGADTMLGGNGSDQYTVDNASDVVTESNTDSVTGGVDTVLTGLASYSLGANVENLRLTSGDAANGLGNSRNNLIWAGAGDNSLDGGSGNDTLSYAFAGAGVVANLTTRIATGGSGNDNTQGFENLIGSNYADALTGNTLANRLDAAGGGDTMIGGAGADTMIGGSGSDLFYVDNVLDVVIETGTDPLSGNDTVWSSMSYSLATSANVENLRITAAGVANATGNELNNTLYSGAGDNILDGGDGIDTASYAYNAGAVTVSLAIQGASQNTGTGGTDTLIGIENLTGSNYNDSLMGNADDNLIEGGVGTDTMSYANAGAGVNASLTSRTATGGEGNDILRRIESLIGSAHNDTLTGSSAGDQLNGGGGADILTGRIGKDSLTGGLGADIFDYNTLAESANSAAKRDQITDLQTAQGDKIDLSDIDANSAVADNQAFSAITSSNTVYSNSTSFTAAGQLYFDQTNHILYGNTDADARAEFAIELVGVASLVLADLVQ